MSDDSGVQFVGARTRKRPHHQMSGSNLERGQPSWRQPGEASSSRISNRDPSRLPPSSPPPIRYPGDGFDFRRPVLSSSPQIDDVIDLTNEPDSPQEGSGSNGTPRRLPRFGRNIMDSVVDLEAEPDSEPPRENPSSPEVQFVGATVRPPLPRSFMGSNLLQMLRFRPSRAHGRSTPGEDAFHQEISRRARQIARRHRHDVDTLFIGDGPRGIDLTLNMDDGLIMEYPGPGITPDNGPRRSSYKPPSPPPEGFTRSAGEDDVVVCPNCDMELGTGDEIKQQIWVAKPCGHVYCGDCARHRALSKAKKAGQTSKPFSKCQVVDCGKPVSAPKSMIQVYL